MQKFTLLLSAMIFILSNNALGQVKDEDKSLAVDAELGLLFTTGNTVSQALKGKVDIKHDMVHWKNNYILEGFSKQDEVIIDDTGTTETLRTAEKYFSSVQTDFKLDSENRGLFIFASYEEDHFSGYEYQGTVAAGYSDRLFKTKNSRFDYSIGPGISFTQTEDTVDENGVIIEEGVTDEAGIVRVSLNYLYQISKTAKFTQIISSDMAVETDKNTKTKSETAISANINNMLALKAAYTINYNSVVPADIEHADTQTSLSLVFSY